jgi:diguanylate cyclase (GGDEF)-like protein/PAS domain S-box-containing protein
VFKDNYRKIKERNKSNQKKQISTAVFESYDGIVITDANADILRVNESFERITGYTQPDVVGKNPRFLQSGRHPSTFYQSMWTTLLTTGHWEGEVWNKNRSGKIYPEWLSITAIKNIHQQITHYVGHFTNLAVIKQAQLELERLSFVDPLTNLFNRRKLMDQLEETFRDPVKRMQTFLLFADLDDFKDINDSLGHHIGDLLLQEVAHRLLEFAHPYGDLVARIGGDEFVMICHRILSVEADRMSIATAYAHQLLERLKTTYRLQNANISITVSIGVRVLSLEDTNPDVAMQEVDLAMYQMKSEGKDGVMCYIPEIKRKAQAEFQIRQKFETAMERKEIFFVYQGQFTSEGTLAGAEMLSRWKQDGQWISPGQFIPAIEKTSMILTLGELSLREAVIQIKKWRKSGIDVPRISINISSIGIHRHREDVVQFVKGVIKDDNLDLSFLTFEITEASLLHEETAKRTLRDLHNLGIQFSIDDFGTGYSSLAYIHTLPIDELKIDRRFIQQMRDSSTARAIVQTILSMGQNLGIRVIAEGVETEEEKTILDSMGCQLYQGYYFMRPEPAQKLVDYTNFLQKPL